MLSRLGCMSAFVGMTVTNHADSSQAEQKQRGGLWDALQRRRLQPRPLKRRSQMHLRSYSPDTESSENYLHWSSRGVRPQWPWSLFRNQLFSKTPPPSTLTQRQLSASTLFVWDRQLHRLPNRCTPQHSLQSSNERDKAAGKYVAGELDGHWE